MARQAEVVEFERSTENGEVLDEVRVDPGSGAVVTAQHFSDPGDDSRPLPGDAAAIEDSSGSGSEQVTGYFDQLTERKSQDGDKRVYSRSGPGVASAEVWLRANGDILIKCLAADRTLQIESAGPVIIKSPDIRVGDESASRPIACVGDIVVGAVNALCGAPGSPLVPVPPATPTASGGVPVVCQIVSGSSRAKAK